MLILMQPLSKSALKYYFSDINQMGLKYSNIITAFNIGIYIMCHLEDNC